VVAPGGEVGGHSSNVGWESGTNRLLNRGLMPRDIRELRDDPVAYAAELRRRWGGLLSYRYIGRTWGSMDAGPSDDTVALRRDMRGPTGAILLAVLGIAAPEGGGRSDLEAVPNPVIHSCQVLDPGYDVRRLEVVSEVLKQGRQMGYSRSRIVDADKPGRVLAVTQGQGISLGVPPAGLERMPVEPIVVEDGPDLPPLWQVFGAARRADGHWALPELSPEVASPDAALHLGPQFVLLETAALDLAVGASGTDQVRAISSHVMFLARGKVGPFRSEGECISGSDGVWVVRVVLHDEGAGDRAVTAASYQFQSAD
jgi:acyl-coenzyme A thioesterase PaaI-like protein